MAQYFIQLPADAGSGGSAYWQDAVVNFAALPAGSVNGEVRMTLDTHNLYYWDGAAWQLLQAFGDVLGPASATDNALARFDGTTGKLVQNSVAILTDAGNLSGIANLNVTGTTTLAASLTGFVKAASGVISSQAAIVLTTDVTGVLPVANGGTNSSTALNSGRAMISTAGAIVESSVTSTELGYLTGVTSAIQTQLDAKVPKITATDNAVTRFDGTTGLVQNSTAILGDDGSLTLAGSSSFLKLPNLTTAQRDALTASNGMLIYNTTLNKTQAYENGSWNDLTGWGS